MMKRMIVLMAAAALLMVGAVPVSAAPGGVPGPPPGHEKARDDVATDSDGEASKLPSHAKAYGKRIKDYYGVPFGHVQQCAGVVDGDEAVEGDEDGEEPKKALEACDELPEFEVPEENGAKAFWVLTEAGLLVVGL